MEALEFKPVGKSDMELILPYLQQQKERTCDFSYGGILMWVDFFRYEYAIAGNTLFIKGLTPGHDETALGGTAFSVPVGALPPGEAVALLGAYCRTRGIPLVFSAVPEQAAMELQTLGARRVEELPSWADYLYEAEALATLRGKKLSKKRNHVNQFMAACPDWSYAPIQGADVAEIHAVAERAVTRGTSESAGARAERQLASRFLNEVLEGNPHITGGVLRAGGEIAAYTIGDVKDDTLYVHIEKAERAVAGSFEMINRCFAADILERYPQVKFINREDDAGDPGLRLAKESYHPVALLRKYNVFF